MKNRDAAEAALDRAVDYIHEHGWCRGTVQDEKGRVCLQGAVMRGTFETTSRGQWYNDTFSCCWSAVGRALENAHPVSWNDRICRDADEAIEALKKAKEFL